MNKSTAPRILRSVLAACAVFASPAALYAQCPLCYRAAASAGGRFIEALRAGILILLPAPFLFGAMIAYMAYRKRDTGAADSEPSASGSSGSTDLSL